MSKHVIPTSGPLVPILYCIIKHVVMYFTLAFEYESHARTQKAAKTSSTSAAKSNVAEIHARMVLPVQQQYHALKLSGLQP